MIRLLVSDIDGTLVTRDKQLTPAAHAAADRLAAAGVALALTSSRPPHGIEVFARALDLTTPRGAFNGAVITDPAGKILSSRLLPADVARMVLGSSPRRGNSAMAFHANRMADPRSRW